MDKRMNERTIIKRIDEWMHIWFNGLI